MRSGEGERAVWKTCGRLGLPRTTETSRQRIERGWLDCGAHALIAGIMRDLMINQEDNPRQCLPPAKCGEPGVAVCFFVSFTVVANFMLLNLVIAVILQNFLGFSTQAEQVGLPQLEPEEKNPSPNPNPNPKPNLYPKHQSQPYQ